LQTHDRKNLRLRRTCRRTCYSTLSGGLFANADATKKQHYWADATTQIFQKCLQTQLQKKIAARGGHHAHVPQYTKVVCRRRRNKAVALGRRHVNISKVPADTTAAKNRRLRRHVSFTTCRRGNRKESSMHMTKTAQIFRRLRRAGHTIAASQRTYATGLNRPPHAGCPRATHRRTGPVVDAGAPISPLALCRQWRSGISRARPTRVS
jgi:hypothetical protein